MNQPAARTIIIAHREGDPLEDLGQGLLDQGFDLHQTQSIADLEMLLEASRPDLLLINAELTDLSWKTLRRVVLDSGRDPLPVLFFNSGSLRLSSEYVPRLLQRVRALLADETVSAPAQTTSTQLATLESALETFKPLWDVHRFYAHHGAELPPPPKACPVNARELGVRLVQFKRAFDQLTPAQVDRELHKLHGALARLRSWQADEIDPMVPAYRLRDLIERDEELREDMIASLIKYHLLREGRYAEEQAKLDYLITKLVRLRNASLARSLQLDEKSVEQIIRELYAEAGFRPPSIPLPARLSACRDLFLEVEEVQQFPQLLSHGLLEKVRAFKAGLGDDFYHPDLLAQLVMGNLLLRRKMERLYRQEFLSIQELLDGIHAKGGEVLVGGNTPTPFESTDKAAEFLRRFHDLLQMDYRGNLENLQQLAELKRVLERTGGLYGVEPFASSPRS